MTCPRLEELSDFALGKLGEQSLEVVAEHLDACPQCQETVARLASDDTFVAKLKSLPDAPSPTVTLSPEPQAPGRSGMGQRSTGPAELGIIGACQAASQRGVMNVPLAELVACVVDLECVSNAEISTLIESLPADKRDDSQELARSLVQAQKVTKFQASLLLKGQGKSLLMGDYVVLDRIGAGGMGQVFRARHRRMDRIVAVKVISSKALAKPDVVQRFQREVKAAARLIHPHIVTAFDAGEQNGAPYLVMELVEGPDLATVLKKQGPLPVGKTLELIQQAARGLAFAHAKGVVHRDVKPGNLLVGRDGVKILDMGLARLDDVSASAEQRAAAELTQDGDVMGTIDYMAPEQVVNTRNADAKSDVYSLGCTLFRLLTGKQLFAGQTLMECIMAHREQPPPAASTHRPEVPPAVDQLIQRMVAKRPDERPTMTEVVTAIDQHKRGAPVVLPAAASAVPVSAAAPQPVTIPQATSIPVESSIPLTKSHAGKPPKRGGGLKWIAAAAGLLFVAFGVVVVIRDKDGNKLAEVNVPDGGTVTVDNRGESESPSVDKPVEQKQPAEPTPAVVPGPVQPAPPPTQPVPMPVTPVTPAPPAPQPVTPQPAPPSVVGPAELTPADYDRERRAAAWVVQVGGIASVMVGNVGLDLRTPAAIPQENFFVRHIALRSLKNLPLDGLSNVAGLKRAEGLELTRTTVTDAGLAPVLTWSNLGALNLYETQITDDSVAKLAMLKTLKTLELGGNPGVTSAAVEQLRRALPNCKIDWTPAASPAVAANPNMPAAPIPVATVPTTVPGFDPIPQTTPPANTRPGLLAIEFPRTRSQDALRHFMPQLTELQFPVGEPAIVQNVSAWKYTPTRNALAVGWLRVDQAGDYGFAVDSFYDSHTLLVAGNVVAAAAVKSGTKRVALTPGLTPILLFGSCFARGEVKLTWQPPGQAALSPIPTNQLLHDPAELTLRTRQVAAAAKFMRDSAPKASTVSTVGYRPGLVVARYQRLPSQPLDKLGEGGVEPAEFGQPTGAPTGIATLSPWTYDKNSNHIASGFLKIDRPGEYVFKLTADWDRVALAVNGVWVYKFRAAQFPQVRVSLEPGMIPWQVVGYCAIDSVTVNWQPPGELEPSAIPADRLFYKLAGNAPTVAAIPQPTATPAPITVQVQPTPGGFFGEASPNTPLGGTADTRDPNRPRVDPPAADKLAEATKTVRELFKAEFAKKKPEEQRVLLTLLLGQGGATKDDLVGRFALLLEARNIAAELADVAGMTNAVASASDLHKIDEAEWLAEGVDLALKKPIAATNAKQLAKYLDERVTLALNTDNFTGGKRLLDLAVSASRKSQDAALTKSLVERGKAFDAQRKAFEAIEKARATLKTSPDDTAANLTMGKYWCFVTGEWPLGLAALAKCDDAQIVELAKASLANPQTPAEQVSLADQWWSKVDKKTALTKFELQFAAVHWYQMAQGQADGLLKAKVEKRLTEAQEAIKALTRDARPERAAQSTTASTAPAPAPMPSPTTPMPTSKPATPVAPAGPAAALGTPRQIAEFYLKLGGTVRIKTDPQTLPINIPNLASLPAGDFTVVDLRLTNLTTVNDNVAAGIRGLPDLTHLYLNGSAITDQALAHATVLSKLEVVNLSGSPQLTDKVLIHLAQIKTLQHLVLNSASISDRGLTQLKTLTDLENISLVGTRVTGSFLSEWQGLEKLTQVNLANTPVDDRTLGLIKLMPKLQFIDLSRTRITDLGLSQLKDHPALKGVYCGDTALTDAGLKWLQNIKTLETVRAQGTRVTSAGVMALNQVLPKCRVDR